MSSAMIAKKGLSAILCSNWDYFDSVGWASFSFLFFFAFYLICVFDFQFDLGFALR